jgi:hypothetical protein
LEYIQVFVIGWWLDRQQVEDRMEDVMLFEHRWQVALVGSEIL